MECEPDGIRRFKVCCGKDEKQFRTERRERKGTSPERKGTSPERKGTSPERKDTSSDRKDIRSNGKVIGWIKEE